MSSEELTSETPEEGTGAATDPVAKIPSTMKRLVVSHSDATDLAACRLEIQEVDTPTPGPGQVLIRVTAAAVNPSDYGTWTGMAADKLPAPIGKEGSGVVVAQGNGGGLTGWMFGAAVGTPVGFVGLSETQGAYSEYVVADSAGKVFPLPADMDVEDGASFFINPYTAVAILDTAASQGCSCIVHTAAASQLGQMMVKMTQASGGENEPSMLIINVVRREEQATLLKNLGATHVIVTGKDEAEWKEELKSKIEELGCTMAFDAVAGSMTGDLLSLLPKRGIVYTYGGLAGNVTNVNPMDLIYKKKQLKGFFLPSWIESGGMLYTIPRMLNASRKVNEGLKDGWSTTQFRDSTMERVHSDLLALLESSITGTKLRVMFDR